MPESLLQQKIYPYDGAYDATKHPLLISPKDVVDSQNIIYTTYSTKKLRPGISPAFPTRVPGNDRILSGIDFWRLGVQREVIYNGFQIIAIDPSTGLFDVISDSFACPIDDVVNFVAFQGLLIACFASGISPKSWDGSGSMTDLSATAPNGAFARVWLNKLWMPDPSVPGRLRHSDTGTVNFTGGDSGTIDLDPNDDDPDGLTAIFPVFFSNLYVTKRFSVYKIKPVILDSTGDLIFSPSKISDGVGCISHNAVAASPGNLFFPSDEGMHYFASTDKISEIDSDDFSAAISPLWVNQTNFKRSQYMHGIYSKELKSYLLLFPSFSALYPNDLWGFSTVAKKWYRWQDYNQTCFFKYVDSTTKKLKTLVGSAQGDLGVIDASVNTDYGIPLTLTLRSGLIAAAGSPNDQFSFQSITPLFVPQTEGNFTLTYKIDGQTIETQTYDMSDDSLGDEVGEDFVIGESVLGGLPQVVAETRTTQGQGMLYEILISHTGQPSGADGFELLGLLVDVDKVSKKTGRTVA